MAGRLNNRRATWLNNYLAICAEQRVGNLLEQRMANKKKIKWKEEKKNQKKKGLKQPGWTTGGNLIEQPEAKADWTTGGQPGWTTAILNVLNNRWATSLNNSFKNETKRAEQQAGNLIEQRMVK